MKDFNSLNSQHVAPLGAGGTPSIGRGQPFRVEFGRQLPYADPNYPTAEIVVNGYTLVSSPNWAGDASGQEIVKNTIGRELIGALMKLGQQKCPYTELQNRVNQLNSEGAAALIGKGFTVSQFVITSIEPSESFRKLLALKEQQSQMLSAAEIARKTAEMRNATNTSAMNLMNAKNQQVANDAQNQYVKEMMEAQRRQVEQMAAAMKAAADPAAPSQNYQGRPMSRVEQAGSVVTPNAPVNNAGRPFGSTMNGAQQGGISAEIPKFCPKCGRATGGNKFCGGCGARLG